jgi:hypothetical protein
MASNRLRRPSLERDRPIRTWSTLFGVPSNGTHAVAGRPVADREAGASNGAPPLFPSSQVLSDAVETGYRVYSEYVRQGQAAAQGFNPAASPNGAAGAPGALPPDMQQLSQRVMQYGWDFAGLWFEMWTRMGGNATGWPPPASGPGSISPAVPAPPPSPPQTTVDAAALVPARLSVCVVSERRAAATLEVRPGAPGPLVVHALRPEGHEAPPIRDVTIESAGDGAVTVKIGVAATQPPGVYNGMIVDGASNLPRGTVSVRVFGDAER